MTPRSRQRELLLDVMNECTPDTRTGVEGRGNLPGTFAGDEA